MHGQVLREKRTVWVTVEGQANGHIPFAEAELSYRWSWGGSWQIDGARTHLEPDDTGLTTPLNDYSPIDFVKGLVPGWLAELADLHTPRG